MPLIQSQCLIIQLWILYLLTRKDNGTSAIRSTQLRICIAHANGIHIPEAIVARFPTLLGSLLKQRESLRL